MWCLSVNNMRLGSDSCTSNVRFWIWCIQYVNMFRLYLHKTVHNIYYCASDKTIWKVLNLNSTLIMYYLTFLAHSDHYCYLMSKLLGYLSVHWRIPLFWFWSDACSLVIARLSVSQIRSWVALSSLVVCPVPSRIGDISTYLHNVMF